MKAQHIINQLQAHLPLYTNLFSDELIINSLTKSGTTVTAVTAIPHGLATGDYGVIVDALSPVGVINLTYIDNGYDEVKHGIETNSELRGKTTTQLGKLVAFAETNLAHDLTEDWQNKINIVGADQSEYNGEHYLLTVPNRKNFTYLLETEPSATPATGTIKLVENIPYNYNGFKEFTVVDATTLTYQLTRDVESPALGNPKLRIRTRISGGVDIERCNDAYTAHPNNKLWGFVVLGDAIANKDRNIYNDAIAASGRGEIFRQIRISPFSFYVFKSSINERAARDARDVAEGLNKQICKSLLRVRFPNIFEEEPYSTVIYSGDGFFNYDGAVYIHRYDYQQVAHITYGDTAIIDQTVAFRDLYLNYQTPFDLSNDDVYSSAHVDLDDEPLT